MSPTVFPSVLKLVALALHAAHLRAEEIAFGDVSADGTLDQRSLDVPVAMARGAENFFISNPMDSHDWAHTKVVRNTLMSELRSQDAGAMGSGKVASLEEELRPIFAALPKNASGRLNNSTARYALHRFFTEKKGWSIKGLQPAGAAWMATMSVTPDVKDITKYMVPTYLQDLLAAWLGKDGFDLHSLALLALVLERLVHSEIVSTVYEIFTTLELPIPGHRNDIEVDDIMSTFLMVHAFGLNLEVSMREDVDNAKHHLEEFHAGWPRLYRLAQDLRKTAFPSSQLSFDEVVQLVKSIGDAYVQWQSQDCQRVKQELMTKPSYSAGRVPVHDVRPMFSEGRRSLLTESVDDMQNRGVLEQAGDNSSHMVIANYINSQSMCLSTASFYTACCPNECEGLLSKLERAIGGPQADASVLASLVMTLSGSPLADSLLKEIPALSAPGSNLVSLHSRSFAAWMHRAFPLECPAPNSHQITNPKTPDEWMGESGNKVQDLEEMMAEITDVLARYTSMGKKSTKVTSSDEWPGYDPSQDIVRISPLREEKSQSRQVLSTIFRIAAMGSMLGAACVGGKSIVAATSTRKDKVEYAFEKSFV